MKLCISLLILALVAWNGVLGGFECAQVKGANRLRSAADRLNVNTEVPCKYPALRGQPCGDYEITLTPGYILLGHQYHLDSMWFSIKVANEVWWQGRCDNKKGVKHVNSKGETNIFTQKGGSKTTQDMFDFSIVDSTVITTLKDGSATLNFTSWDPSNKTYFENSYWSFVCNKNDSVKPYPDQLCGAKKKDGFRSTTNCNRFEKGKKDEGDGKDDGFTPHQMFLFDLFKEEDVGITQMDPKCIAVEETLQHNCHGLEKDAIRACAQILSPTRRPPSSAECKSTKNSGQSKKKGNLMKCISKYSCGAMDVFVDCITWMCSNKKNQEACYNVGRAIDSCATLEEGNLSHEVDKAKCYKDFIPIIQH